MFISAAEGARVGLALIPPGLATGVLDETIPIDSFINLDQLSGILSDADVSYYLWYNTKVSEFAKDLASNLISISDETFVKNWIEAHRVVYNKESAECNAKYSIAGGGSRRALAVDYGAECFYIPRYSSGVLYLIGCADNPYVDGEQHYYDAVMSELAKSLRVSDLANFAAFDKYVSSAQ